jgi:anti-sigma factor RsiW
MDFSPPVHQLTVAGSSLVGGRVDYVDGRVVAAVVYRLGDHVVDSFVWPTSDGDSGVTRTTRRGFQLARWSRNGMAHCPVSDVSAEQLAAVTRQLEAGSREQPSS